MFSAFLITFRETLEAALVIGLILTFLSKTGQTKFTSYVWRGIIAGVGIAVILAAGLEFFYGGLTGRVEKISEGVLMFVTAGFLTWMILWVHKQKDVAKKIKEKVSQHAQAGYGLGIFLLITTSVFREGTETVLYLKASSLVGQTNQLFGALLGIVGALFIGYILYKWALRINLGLVFRITSIFLLLFAAGLVAHGVHEFQELRLLPIFPFDPIINVSRMLDHTSTFGSFLRTLFGYTSKPTFLEALSYTTYILFILWLKRVTDRKITPSLR